MNDKDLVKLVREFDLSVKDALKLVRSRVGRSSRRCRNLGNATLGLLAICTLAIALSGCQKTPHIYIPLNASYSTTKPASCWNFLHKYSETTQGMKLDTEDCRAKAESGDVEAMETLGFIYGKMLDRSSANSQAADGREAVKWLKAASDKGSSAALYWLREIYRGHDNLVPENTRIADQYLKEGLARGYDWAILADIWRKDEVNDKTAIYDLIKLGESGKCYAANALVYFYSTGKMLFSSGYKAIDDRTKYEIKTNLTKAYFWSLVAITLKDQFKTSDRVLTYKYFWQGTKDSQCRRPRALEWEDREKIPPALIAKAQDAATTWVPGTPEPDLPPPPEPKSEPRVVQPNTKPTPSIAAVPKSDAAPQAPDRIISPGIGELEFSVDESPSSSRWSWRAVALPGVESSSDAKLQPSEVFTLANTYVWRVFAARSKNELKTGVGLSQGSAVAVAGNQLVTNCHVVEGRPIVIIKHGEKLGLAKVISGDATSDRCVLESRDLKLEAVPVIRAYGSLGVGERVFTVGSPSGLENTLGEGIISGLRSRRGQRLVQTTAQISPGSSGGGLFDSAGRLVGITTFMLRDAQSLNFAIAVEEFGK